MTKRISDSPNVYCMICEKETNCTSTTFPKYHLKAEHDISTQEYYDKFLKKDGEGKCKVCSNDTKFLNIVKGYRVYCCPKCTQADKEVREKIKSSTLEKTGYEHNSLDPKNWEKVKKTNLEKYGTEWLIAENGKNRVETEEQKQNRVKKIRKTCLEKYGVDNIFKSSEFRKFQKNLNQDYFKSLLPDGYDLIDYNGYKDKHKMMCPKEHIFEATYYFVRQRKNDGREPCLICDPLNSTSISNFHKEVLEFINSYYKDEIVVNDKILISPLELDIVIPKLNLSIEVNGIYWHSDKNVEPYHHQFKTDLCEKIGIKLIHIYEDDWYFKGDIVKSRLLNLLGLSPNKIYARNCELKEISFLDSKQFLIENHIQSFCVDKFRYGLYHNGRLVSLMTFGNLRVNMNQKREDGVYELTRFCNVLNTYVIGAASKLFNHFIKNHDFKKIISYADRSWSNGNLYKTLGFDFVKKTKKNYWYVINNRRINRFNFRKDVLVLEGYDVNKSEREIMEERGIPRIYDSGSLLFEFMKNK